MSPVFRAIDTTQFQRLFVEWIQAWLSPEVAGKVVAIDGKMLRGSHDGGQSPIHLVSAFASEAGIVLGHGFLIKNVLTTGIILKNHQYPQ